MSAPYPFNKYYFEVKEWIAAIHELEKYPELPPLSVFNPSVVATVTEADVSRWMQLFGIPADEARFRICRWRNKTDWAPPKSQDTLNKWP